MSQALIHSTIIIFTQNPHFIITGEVSTLVRIYTVDIAQLLLRVHSVDCVKNCDLTRIINKCLCQFDV